MPPTIFGEFRKQKKRFSRSQKNHHNPKKQRNNDNNHHHNNKKMVYLESISGKRFWTCQVDGNNVETRYGNVGCVGQKLVKQCDTPRDARALRKRQIAKKRQGGRFQNVKRSNKTPTVTILSPNVKKLHPTKSRPRALKKIQKTKFGIKKEGQSKTNDTSKNNDAIWYYYLENDPLGKKDGWYPFEDVNSEEIEGYNNSDSVKHLSLCVIRSKTTGFRYLVDLKTMQQTNIKTGTTRPIRRKAKN